VPEHDSIRSSCGVVPGTLLVVALIACAACSTGPSGPGDAAADLAPFPSEPRPDQFAGLDYPAHEGDLSSLGSPRGPVFLIGVDGATWDLILPMAARGELPNFAALMAEAAHGVLQSEEPTISPALWATIATGVPRFEHGVFDFLVKRPGFRETAEAGPLDRRSPAVWEHVGAAGGRATVVSWFGSFPAEPIDGIYVSKGCDPTNPRPEQVHPEPFAATLRDRAQVQTRSVDQEQIGFTDYLAKTLLDDARTLATLRVALEQEMPDLVVAYFQGIDVVQHVTWGDMDPASLAFDSPGNRDPRYAGVIPAFYRYIDHALGQIRDLAPADATLIVVSDHGGGPLLLEHAFHLQLDVLLETLGLQTPDGGEVLTIDELYLHDKRIWLNLEAVEADGEIPLSDAASKAREVAARLRGLRTDRNESLFETIEVLTDRADWKPGAPALVVRFSPAALLTDTVRDGKTEHSFAEVRMRHSDVTGEHRRDGILLVHGPEVRPGPLARPANLYQVAPTVLYLLGLPQDRRMLRWAPADGGVLEAAIDPELLASMPIRAVADYPGADRSYVARRHEAPVEDPVEAEALERLRSLGYIR
jgi:predicted AlkP superfamily phosphohydrolase/phosphomutase